jgi:hypothetical protein
VNGTLRDGRPIPKDGEVLRYEGPLVMCKSGLHASREPFDALQYAPGPTLSKRMPARLVPGSASVGKSWAGSVWRLKRLLPALTCSRLCLVNCAGEIVEGDDKLICTERTIVARMDATDLMRYFARMQALSVIHLWDTEPQEVVLDYLMTGDESLRAAAWDAAWDAARAAAWAAARAAAWDAAWDAARDAAWAAARAAAWAAAWDAARDAAWDAAWAAAWAAARAAARKDFNGLVYECFWEYGVKR